jgi:hypothetical protein
MNGAAAWSTALIGALVVAALAAPGCRFTTSLDGYASAGGGAGGGNLQCANGGTCRSGCLDCDGTPGCETDPTNDPHNCGGCGFDCGAGRCDHAVCVLADADRPTQLVVDATNVYFAEFGEGGVSAGAVMSVPIVPTASAAATQIAGNQSEPVALAEAVTALFWANFTSGGNILTSQKTDQGTSGVQVAGANSPRGVACDDSKVYWTNSGNGTIGARTQDLGTSPAQLVASDGPSNTPWGIAADFAAVYWTDKTGGRVRKYDKTTKVVSTLATGQQNPVAIAVEGSSLYWADAGDCAGANGSIWKMPANSDPATPATQIAQSQACPSAITADADGVYWTDYGTTQNNNYQSNGGVYAALAGDPPQPVAGANRPQGVATDSTGIYWTEQGSNPAVPGSGSVRKASRAILH